MKNTSLCYIENEGSFLMLHRIKKENDVNKNKWIGVGGKFECRETPEECMKREVFEETGLIIKSYRYCGIVTFVSDIWETEYMHLFTSDNYEGKIHECNEGVLEWVKKDNVKNLPIWEGDKIFLKLMAEKIPFFSLKLVYTGENLSECILNGKKLNLKY
jgi:8-oxo-dGTP diphosphatase